MTSSLVAGSGSRCTLSVKGELFAEGAIPLAEMKELAFADPLVRNRAIGPRSLWSSGLWRVGT